MAVFSNSAQKNEPAQGRRAREEIILFPTPVRFEIAHVGFHRGRDIVARRVSEGQIRLQLGPSLTLFEVARFSVPEGRHRVAWGANPRNRVRIATKSPGGATSLTLRVTT